MGAMANGIIDAWAQPALRQGLLELPEVVRLFKQSGTANLLETGVTPAEMIQQMDAAGIALALLSAWHRPGKWIFSNDQVAEFIRLYPDRFVGVASVDLEKPVAAVRELERAVRVLGFKALRVLPWLWNRPPNDKLYFPLCQMHRAGHPLLYAGGAYRAAHAFGTRPADSLPG